MSILEAANIWKQYNLGECPVNALAGVDLCIEKGDFVAIMGPSGSGKSTLLNMLGGLDRPSSGEITLAGLKLSVLDDDHATLARRHNVGFIFQSFNLLPTLTAEENIALPIIIDGRKPEKYQEKINQLLELVDLSDRRSHKPNQLSGGEQQRVAIARALITEPAIVLADEPTGNLDSKTGKAIMELLQESCAKMQQTIIMVTHDPRAAAFTNRVIFLKDGLVKNTLFFDRKKTMDQRLRMIMDHTMEESNEKEQSK